MENDGGYASSMPTCLGVWGHLFGHKFNTRGFLVETYRDNLPTCQRCGFRPQ